MRGKALGLDFREGLCSAKGNRTPIARMKILSTNRYTMAPRVRQQACICPYRSASWTGNFCLRSSARKHFVSLLPEGTIRSAWEKSGCKSTAFFWNTQIFLHFFTKKRYFV